MSILLQTQKSKLPGGHSIVKKRGDWLDSLGSGILVGKKYFGILIWMGVAKMIHMDN